MDLICTKDMELGYIGNACKYMVRVCTIDIRMHPYEIFSEHKNMYKKVLSCVAHNNTYVYVLIRAPNYVVTSPPSTSNTSFTIVQARKITTIPMMALMITFRPFAFRSSPPPSVRMRKPPYIA